MKMVLRVEEDRSITRLLRRHKKYYQEYRLNVYCQGYEHLIMKQFAPMFFAIAIGNRVMQITRDNLKKAKLI